MSAPVASGTALYFAAVCMVLIWAWAAQRGGYIKFDDFQYII